ncbi:fibrillin-2-like isoform X1, partial [Paramuricea clavata]
INECTLGFDNCGSEARCTNTIGSFTCRCNVGTQVMGSRVQILMNARSALTTVIVKQD